MEDKNDLLKYHEIVSTEEMLTRATRKKMLWTTLFSIAIFTLEFLGGLWSNSLAIVA